MVHRKYYDNRRKDCYFRQRPGNFSHFRLLMKLPRWGTSLVDHRRAPVFAPPHRMLAIALALC